MESMKLRKDRYGYEQRIKNGGLVFYVCTFATIVNVLLYYIDFYVKVPVGLHTTQYWFVEHCTDIGLNPWVGAILTVLVAAGVAVAGYFAREKRKYYVFMAGALLFSMDILGVFTGDTQIMSFAGEDVFATYDKMLILLFDVYGAFMLFSGYRSMRKINEIDAQVKELGMMPIPADDNPLKDMSKSEREAYEKESRRGLVGKMFSPANKAEESVVSIDHSAAWPEPAQSGKKAKAERIAREDAQAAAESEQAE